jgi:hypothetical protein
MIDNPRLRSLLDQLHESHATPEEVCRSYPELLPEVRARWLAVCRVRAELDAMFPTPAPGEGAPALLPRSASLPQVPGYNVEAELGHGGMGVVYRAWHLRLHRRVALKMLLAGAHAQPAERERFLREAEAVARAVSCIAISSRPTSCSPRTAHPRSPTLAWRGTSIRNRS